MFLRSRFQHTDSASANGRAFVDGPGGRFGQGEEEQRLAKCMLKPKRTTGRAQARYAH